MAVKNWLIEHEPGLADEIFLDLDPHTGIRPGERWRQAFTVAILGENWDALWRISAF